MFKSKLTSLSDRWLLLPLFFIFSAAYLILAMHLPVSIYTGWVHDDALYWGNAYQIVSGNWLGDYGKMTLAKGPGFPLVLAVNAVLGIPVTLLLALLYLFACGLTANTLRDLGLNKYLVLTIFVVILFHPELFPTRIIRDNIYPALSLIIISGVSRLVFIPKQKDQRLMSIAPYGLAFGLFWVTREEGIWIVPGMLILLSLKMFQLRKQNLPVRDVCYRFAWFLSVAAMFISLIASINYYKYGKFEVVDFKGRAFSHALKSLNSVDAGKDLPYLPVSFKKRQEIYKISPSFLQLKDYFEDKGKGWTYHSCASGSWTCGDYDGGCFMWALRDAVASKGYYKSPKHAAAFYNGISKEIKKSCDSGLIKCKTNPVPFMPNISLERLKELPEKMVEALSLAMVQFPVSATKGPSLSPLDQLQKVRLFLGNPLTTFELSERRTELRGWFYSANHDWIFLNCLVTGKVIKRKVDRLESPDIAQHFKNPNANFQRFSLSVPGNENCSISSIDSPSKNLQIKTLLEKQKTGLKFGKNGTLYFDKISQTEDSLRQKLFLDIKNSLAKLYRLIVPVLVLLGALTYFIYLISLWLGKVSLNDVFILGTSMWCLLLSRILLIILVDISSFPAINALYMSAAFPIICLASFLSLQLVFEKKKL
jgi:hypothetical protein